jgi:hypothetical protein
LPCTEPAVLVWKLQLKDAEARLEVQRRELVSSRKVQEDLRRQIKHLQCTNTHHEAQVGRDAQEPQRTLLKQASLGV